MPNDQWKSFAILQMSLFSKSASNTCLQAFLFLALLAFLNINMIF